MSFRSLLQEFTSSARLAKVTCVGVAVDTVDEVEEFDGACHPQLQLRIDGLRLTIDTVEAMEAIYVTFESMEA